MFNFLRKYSYFINFFNQKTKNIKKNWGEKKTQFFQARSNAVKTAKKKVELEKNSKFGSISFSSVRFEVRDQKLDSIEFGI